MIAPRRTRLHRAADPAALRHAVATLVSGVPALDRPDAFVLVPTTAAGEQLRRSLEHRLTADQPVLVPPHIGTRAALMAEWHRRLPTPPDLLDEFEREVLLAAAAREADGGGTLAPFRLRPGLVAEMLAFYDALRRQRRTVERFEEYLVEELSRDVELDRGAARLLQQTRFLAAAFGGYERRRAATGADDEHALRDRLLTTPATAPLRTLIVATGDRLADAAGLWPADVDLITRIAGLEAIDVAATERQLAAGLLERLHEALPGIEEVEVQAPPSGRPFLHVPSADAYWFTCRDREEELSALARRLKRARRTGQLPESARVAVVVRRPLPYLYLARDVFGRSGIPYEALDTLPLAAEPPAAALDLVFDGVTTQAGRAALLALLRSPHVAVPDGPLPAESLGAFDRALADVRYLGDVDRLATLVEAWEALGSSAAHSREAEEARTALPAARAALGLARQLQPLMQAGPAPAQIDRLLAVLESTSPAPTGDEAVESRLRRIRTAIVQALQRLRDAYARHDTGTELDAATLAAAVRRWLGARTFAPRTGDGGVQLIEASAALFGEFDDVHLLGLVDADWPERERRSIFYPALLLGNLGWPDERGRQAASRAAFLDLVHLAGTRVSLSTVTLEDDALVEPSVLLDEVAGAGVVPQVEVAVDDEPRVFPWEGLALPPAALDGLDPAVAEWAALRTATTTAPALKGRGEAGPWTLPRVSVTRVELYRSCPFKFYAAEVLGLDEPTEDTEGRTALERGEFLHAVFETFFRQWQHLGHGAISRTDLPAARTLLREVAGPMLETLSPAEAAVERLRLFGSAAGAGIAERVFTMEAERDEVVVERLLEHVLDGTYTFTAADGRTRTIVLRAKADRIDLTAEGRLYLIDYKTRYVPDRNHALQLPLYAWCATHQLRGYRGRDWTLADAVYVSFEGRQAVTSIASSRTTLAARIAAAHTSLIEALDHIAAGTFPVKPRQRRLCETCAYRSVCRRDYVVDADADESGSAPPSATEEAPSE